MSLLARRVLPPPAPWLKDSLWRRAQAVPSLDLRFADNKSLVDSVSGQNLITFTRASTATFVGSDGTLQTAATDAPRFDHNPTTGESLGLLVEEQRTNLLLRSEEFDNASWLLQNNITRSANSAISPSGTLSADRITISPFTYIFQGLTITSGFTYTFSCYVKSVSGGNQFKLGAYDGSTFFNSDLKTASSSWQRFLFTFTALVTSTTTFYPLVVDSTSAGVFDIWGAQVEAGASPTSYIPTTTSQVTRAADVATITGSNFSRWYRQDEGTVFAEYSNQATAGQDRRIFNTSEANGFATNGSSLFLSNGTQAAASFNTFVGGANIGVMHSSTPLVVGVARKAAYSIQVNSRVLVVGGAAPLISSNSYTPPSNIVSADLGQAAGVAYMNGHIRRLTYFPARLSNTTLQRITQ